MPYPNEHSCRINNPGKYTRFIRKNDVNPNIIIGYTKDGKSEVQAYRFPVKDWSEDKARSFCMQKGGVFEPALKKGKEEEVFEITLSEDGKPKWYLVIPKGKYSHPEYGTLNFDESFFQDIINNFKNNVLGNTKPFIDQDHDMRGAAGWVNDLRMSDKGLEALIEWTPVGVELIKNKIYRYFSPTIGDYTDPKTGKTYKNVFRGGALTNIPFLKELPEIELSELSEGIKKQINIKILKETKEGKMEELIKLLKEKLNLEDEIEEDAILEALKEYFEKNEKELKEKEELEKKIKEMNEKISELEKKLEEGGNKNMTETEQMLKKFKEANENLAKKLIQLEMERDIGKAMSEGRILPEKKEFWEKKYKENPEMTKEIIENLPIVIEFKEKGTQKTKKNEIELDEETKEAARIFGLSEEDFKKYGEEV